MQTLYNKIDEAIRDMRDEGSISEEVKDKLKRIVMNHKQVRMNVGIKQDKVRAAKEKLDLQEDKLSDYRKNEFMQSVNEIANIYYNNMPVDKVDEFIKDMFEIMTGIGKSDSK